MWDLKHIDELKAVVDEFVEGRFGIKTEIDTDFAYYPHEEIVTWSFFMTEKSDKYFQQFVEMEFPNVTADIFLWSLLHEVGHHMTFNEWNDAQFDFNEEVKEAAAKVLEKENPTEAEDKYAHFLYFSTPDERRATEWAAHYMETHSEGVEKFWLKFVEEFNKFLTLNKVKIN